MQLTHRRFGLAALVSTAALTLAACGGGGNAGTAASSPAADAPAASSAAPSGSASGSASASPTAQAGSVQVTDMAGDAATVPVPAQSVVATDNRVFRTLDDWGVQLSAAPLPLMDENTVSYPSQQGVIDLGNHREPNMEGFVEAQPDLVLNGQRFADYKDEIAGLIPEGTALLDTDVQEGQPLADELRRLTTLLGQTFGQQGAAETLISDFDTSIQRATEAYNPEETVVGLIASGGDLQYSAPTTGRSIGPVFDMLNLTPALEREGSTNHQGDDISVEAIAAADPDWMLVLDRDAATGSTEEGYTAAAELIENSEALQGTTAVREGNIVYLPKNFYVHEDIQNYTTFLNDLGAAFAGE